MGYPKSTYSVTVSDPVAKEELDGTKSTVYRIKIINETGISQDVMIDLARYESAHIIPTQDEIEQIVKHELTKDHHSTTASIETAKCIIDYSSGAIGSAEATYGGWLKEKIYLVNFHLHIDPSHLEVAIASSIPWEHGTLQLLNTLHIEKVK